MHNRKTHSTTSPCLLPQSARCGVCRQDDSRGMFRGATTDKKRSKPQQPAPSHPTDISESIDLLRHTTHPSCSHREQRSERPIPGSRSCSRLSPPVMRKPKASKSDLRFPRARHRGREGIGGRKRSTNKDCPYVIDAGGVSPQHRLSTAVSFDGERAFTTGSGVEDYRRLPTACHRLCS